MMRMKRTKMTENGALKYEEKMAIQVLDLAKLSMMQKAPIGL